MVRLLRKVAADAAQHCVAVMLFLNFIVLCVIAASIKNQAPHAVAGDSTSSVTSPPSGRRLHEAAKRQLRVDPNTLQWFDPDTDCSCYGHNWTAIEYNYGTPFCTLAFPTAAQSTGGDVFLGLTELPACNYYATNASVSDLSTTVRDLATTVQGLSAALSCASNGRRLGMDEPTATSAKVVMDKFLASRPHIAAKMDGELMAGMEELGQHFGLPARA